MYSEANHLPQSGERCCSQVGSLQSDSGHNTCNYSEIESREKRGRLVPSEKKFPALEMLLLLECKGNDTNDKNQYLYRKKQFNKYSIAVITPCLSPQTINGIERKYISLKTKESYKNKIYKLMSYRGKLMFVIPLILCHANCLCLSFSTNCLCVFVAHCAL